MELDAHQLAEFDQHWGASYVKVKDQPFYVTGMYDRGRSLASGTPIGADGRTVRGVTFDIGDMEQLGIPAGFYGDIGNFFMFSRSPNQGTKRGVARSNAFCLNPVYEGRTLSSTWLQLETQHIATAFKEHYTKPKLDGKLFKEYIHHVMAYGGGFSIGKNYAGIYYRSPKRGQICSLSSVGGLIGYFEPSGKVILSGKLAHMEESVKEELSERFNTEIQIHVQ